MVPIWGFCVPRPVVRPRDGRRLLAGLVRGFGSRRRVAAIFGPAWGVTSGGMLRRARAGPSHRAADSGRHGGRRVNLARSDARPGGCIVARPVRPLSFGRPRARAPAAHRVERVGDVTETAATLENVSRELVMLDSGAGAPLREPTAGSGPGGGRAAGPGGARDRGRVRPDRRYQ